MKKIICISAFLLCAAVSVNAQDSTETTGQKIKESAKDVGHAVSKGAKKVGHETAEIASKGKAKITDQKYNDRVGPNGETVYIDNHSRYYWVDEKGHRHYTQQSELKPKERP